MTPDAVIRIAWLAWIASWLLAAGWSNRTVARVGARRERTYRIIVAAGSLLLFRVFPRSSFHLWYARPAIAWGLAGVALLGLLATWWARLSIGRLWSGQITRKEDHRIVDTGPYALVRHPIYSGIILATLATAAQQGTVSTLLGAALMAAGFYVKARMEEEFLRGQLGAHAYALYARRVPMLVPFGVWRRGH